MGEGDITPYEPPGVDAAFESLEQGALRDFRARAREFDDQALAALAKVLKGEWKELGVKPSAAAVVAAARLLLEWGHGKAVAAESPATLNPPGGGGSGGLVINIVRFGNDPTRVERMIERRIEQD